MNNLSNAALLDHHCSTCKPIPSLALYFLIPLFVIGLSVSIFILIVVHNALSFVSFIVLSLLVLAFIVWNTRNWRSKGAIFFFLRSLPETDLRLAEEGQLVKITGVCLLCSFHSFQVHFTMWVLLVFHNFHFFFLVFDLRLN